MLVDIYKSNSDPKKFLFLPAGSDIKKFSFAALDVDFRKVSSFKKGVEVDPASPRPGFNNAIIVQDIADHGFSAHTAEIFVPIWQR